MAPRAPEVEAILPGGRADAQLAGAPIEVLGLPDHAPSIATTGRFCSRSSNAWVKLRPRHRGPSSANNCRGACAFRVGDRIEVPAPGGSWTLDVAGIYADYGNPKGQIAVNFRRR